jgi:hypothetical protein
MNGLRGCGTLAGRLGRITGAVFAETAPCALETVDGHYLTAVGGGGRTTDVIHSDATRVGSWEEFRLASCVAV